MMEYQYIFPFVKEEFSFSGAHRFYTEDWSFLLSDNGTSIVLKNILVESLVNQQPSEDLAFKLYQRGFGNAYGEPRIQVPSDTVYPTLFMIDFTTKCNCNCIYCLRHFENVGDNISPEMVKYITQYIIDYCRQYRIHHISFQPWGGEPLLALNQIIECKKMFDAAGIHADFNLQTNGLLLTLDNYEKLRANNIGIGVSLDGIENVHDAHRVDLHGKTTHSRIVNNLREIKSKYPDANIGTLSVNSNYSINHISESINFIVSDLGLHNIKFNLVHPSGIESFDCSMLISEESIKSYVDAIIDSVTEQIHAGRLCYEANIMDKLSNLLDKTNDNICNAMGCRGGTSFISFDQAGNIYPCEMIGRQEYFLGNIADEQNDLVEMICNAKVHNKYYASRNIDDCVKCPFLYFCRGGCKASCLAYGKGPCQIDHIECTINKALYPRLIELILTDPELINKMFSNRLWIGQ